MSKHHVFPGICLGLFLVTAAAKPLHIIVGVCSSMPEFDYVVYLTHSLTARQIAVGVQEAGARFFCLLSSASLVTMLRLPRASPGPQNAPPTYLSRRALLSPGTVIICLSRRRVAIGLLEDRVE